MRQTHSDNFRVSHRLWGSNPTETWVATDPFGLGPTDLNDIGTSKDGKGVSGSLL